MKRPENLIYAVDELPPLAKLPVLGLQQVALISIYLIIFVIILRHAGTPPEMARQALSLSMIALGLGALLQAVWKGPVGSGYLAPPVLSAMYLQASLTALEHGGLPLVFGMTMVAGGVESALAWVLPRLRRVFPPVVSGVIVAAVGFEVGLIGIKEVLDVNGSLGPASFASHFVVANLTLAAMAGFSVWGRGFFRLFCALLGILVGVVAAMPLGLFTPEALKQLAGTPVFALPRFHYPGYAFDLSVLLPFLVAAIAAGLRTAGVITTSQQINDDDWVKPEMQSIRGGILADGLSCVISGFLGSAGLSSSPSSVGISKATGATSRYIALAVTAWFGFLAFFPKVAMAFLALPPAVTGAALIFTGSILLVSGIKLITSNPLDTRKTFIVGISLLLGLSRQVFPAYYQKLAPWMQPLTGSTLAIATLVAILLNLLFRLGNRRSASLTIKGEGPAWTQIEDFLQRQGKIWELKPEMLALASRSAKEAFDLIVAQTLSPGPVTLELSFDDPELSLGISYQGNPLNLTAIMPAPAKISEDIPFSQGLSGSWRCLCRDSSCRGEPGGDCRITLVF
jgi:NCS2 family nucleobase:cation symporter-2